MLVVVSSFIYCSSLGRFSEATDKLKELQDKADKLSTVRKKLYNNESGKTTKDSPTFVRKTIRERNISSKQSDEEGLTVILSHSKLRELLESFRSHLNPDGKQR